MTKEHILIEETGLITTIILNRPDKRNAMHQALIVELSQALKQIAQNDSRILIIRGAGEHFCAGGDIAWMQKMALCSRTENEDDAQLLADLLYQLYSFTKPTIVLVHGAVLGGGMGLLAAADIAIAAKNASFGLPEVKIGIAPSIISPYLLNAMSERIARYYFLTGERFDAEKAQQIGLIHQITEADQLIEKGMHLARTLVENSPHALTVAKQLIRDMVKEKITEQLAQKTAEHLAELRATPEAQEGLNAFLQKRKPVWN